MMPTPGARLRGKNFESHWVFLIVHNTSSTGSGRAVGFPHNFHTLINLICAFHCYLIFIYLKLTPKYLQVNDLILRYHMK